MFARFTVWLSGLGLLLLSLACGSQPPLVSTLESSLKASDELKLASTPWVPFTGDKGQPRVALYVVERALQRAGYMSSTAIVPDGTLTELLRQGKYDGSAALWTGEDRAEFLLYSDPYLENRLLLVGRKGSDVSATSLNQLGGKRIGLVEGYAYGKEVDTAKEPTFVRAKSTEENLRDLVASKVDYILLDALLVEYLFEQQPKQSAERLEVGEVPLIKRTLHFGVLKSRPNAEEIIKRFNSVLGAMMRDGSYHVALQVDWIMADVDGDGRKEMVGIGPAVGTKPPEHGYTVFAEATAAQPAKQAANAASASGSPGAPLKSNEQQTRYFVGGKVYESWQEVPESFKIQPGANDVGGGHPTMSLVNW